MFGSIGATEWIIIAIAFLVLFGSKRIPEFARGLGQGIKEFRKATSDIKKEIEEGSKDLEDSISSEETKSNNK